MKKSDLNHLRRLLGWIRCEIGQDPAGQQQTMIDIAGKLGIDSIDADAKARLVEGYRHAEAVPVYVRDAVKALEKALAAAGRDPGAVAPRATAETRANTGFTPGVDAGREPMLDDAQIERGLAEIGVYVWGQRGEDWLAGAEFAIRLMQEQIQQLTAKRHQGGDEAYGHKPDALDTSSGHSAPQASDEAELRAAYNEWQDKTDFIQEWVQSGKLPVKYLGWHRADVMRDLIEQATPAPTAAEGGQLEHANRPEIRANTEVGGGQLEMARGDAALRSLPWAEWLARRYGRERTENMLREIVDAVLPDRQQRAGDLTEALRPFAGLEESDLVGTVFQGKDDGEVILHFHRTGRNITLGDFRRARAVLAARKEVSQ